MDYRLFQQIQQNKPAVPQQPEPSLLRLLYRKIKSGNQLGEVDDPEPEAGVVRALPTPAPAPASPVSAPVSAPAATPGNLLRQPISINDAMDARLAKNVASSPTPPAPAPDKGLLFPTVSPTSPAPVAPVGPRPSLFMRPPATPYAPNQTTLDTEAKNLAAMNAMDRPGLEAGQEAKRQMIEGRGAMSTNLFAPSMRAGPRALTRARADSTRYRLFGRQAADDETSREAALVAAGGAAQQGVEAVKGKTATDVAGITGAAHVAGEQAKVTGENARLAAVRAQVVEDRVIKHQDRLQELGMHIQAGKDAASSKEQQSIAAAAEKEVETTIQQLSEQNKSNMPGSLQMAAASLRVATKAGVSTLPKLSALVKGMFQEKANTLSGSDASKVDAIYRALLAADGNEYAPAVQALVAKK